MCPRFISNYFQVGGTKEWLREGRWWEKGRGRGRGGGHFLEGVGFGRVNKRRIYGE